RARILRIFHLHNECAPSAVDERDLSGETARRESLTGIGDRSGAIAYQRHVSSDTRSIKRWPEYGPLRPVGAGCAARIHYNLVVTLAGPQEHLHTGLRPSTGVAKFALSVPAPSWPSAFTGSLSRPPLPKLFCWKLPAASVNPCLYRVS